MTTLKNNENIRRIIESSAAKRTFSHAYIITGAEGSGKKAAAEYLAAAILCESGGARPCGACVHCRKTEAAIHPDLIFTDNEGKEFVVDQAREIRADVYTRPNEGGYKVYIIANAQDMNRNAQNALLKVLEEPPGYAVFILLTVKTGKLLPTIRSRCTELRTLPAQNETSEDNEGAIRFLSAVSSRDELKIFEASGNMAKLKRDELKVFLDTLLHYLYLSLKQKAGAEICISDETGGKRDEITQLLANSLTNSEILHTIEEIKKAQDYCEFNAGPGHLAGALAVLCWEAVR